MGKRQKATIAFNQAVTIPTDRTMNFSLNVTHADDADKYFSPTDGPGAVGNLVRGMVNGNVVIAPTAGTLRNFSVKGDTNSAGPGETIFVNVNNVDTALTVHIPAGSLYAIDATHTVVVAAGDEISIHVDAASDGNFNQWCAGLELVP